MQAWKEEYSRDGRESRPVTVVCCTTRAGHWLEMADSIASPEPRKYEGSNESDWISLRGWAWPGPPPLMHRWMMTKESSVYFLCRTGRTLGMVASA